MFFKILINFIFGYLNVELEGYYIERFINTCISKKIFLWGIKRTKSTILLANIGAEDFKTVAKIAKKHGCKIKIKNKSGLPFILRKYKKRKIFLIFLIALFATIYTLSKFIWNIELTGNTHISSEEIINILQEEGLKVGSLKSKVDKEKIINKIRYKREDIAWIGIEITGTNANIKIVEADSKPEIVDENEHCNIIATKDGVIEKISAQNGTLMVKKGDSVKKGDILIAGWMEGKYTGKNYVNANGEVKAKITYLQNEKIEKKEVKKVQTGNYENKYSIKFNNFKINLYKTLSKYEKYDTIYTNKKIKLFSNFYLPIEVIKYTNYEVTESENTYGIENAKIEGQRRAEEKLNKLISGEVSKKDTNITEHDTYYDVKVTYEVIEEIGTKEKIVY